MNKDKLLSYVITKYGENSGHDELISKIHDLHDVEELRVEILELNDTYNQEVFMLNQQIEKNKRFIEKQMDVIGHQAKALEGKHGRY